MKRAVGGTLLAVTLMTGCGVVVRGCGLIGRMEDNAVDTVYTEFSPSAMLAKYEWFKNTAAALDAKHADIDVFTARLKATKTIYGADAGRWPRDVRESFAQKETEVAGLKASYNLTAADYNAQMVKFNWSAFERFGNAPAGAREALPREIKPYVEE